MARRQKIDFKWQDVPRFNEGFDIVGKVTEANLRQGYVFVQGEVTLNDPKGLTNVVHLDLATLKSLHKLSTGRTMHEDTKDWLIETGQVAIEKTEKARWRVSRQQLLDYATEHVDSLQKQYITGRLLLFRTSPKKGKLLNMDTDEVKAYLVASEHYAIIPSEMIKNHFDKLLKPRGMEYVNTIKHPNSLALVYAFPHEDAKTIEATGLIEKFKKYLAVLVGRNDGSLSIRLYYGINVISCSNQLWFKKGGEDENSVWVKISHYEKKTDPLSRLTSVIDNVFTGFDGVFGTIQKAMNNQIPALAQNNLIQQLKDNGRLSEKITDKILARLSSESQTLWGVTQAMTYIGTHDDELTDVQSTDLKTYAGHILQHWVNVKDLQRWKYTDFTESSTVIDQAQTVLIGGIQ